MAFTTILVTVLMVTVVNAGFTAWGDDNMPTWNPAIFPKMPAMPQFPTFNFPTPPPFIFPFNLNFPKVPTVQSIAAAGNKPGFTGIAVVSHSTATKGENGEIIRDGQSTIVTNQNGEVTFETIGSNNPPIIITQSKIQFPEINSPKFRSHFKEPKLKSLFEPLPTMKPFDFDSFTFKPIPVMSPEEIKNHVPGKNEKFVGYSSSSNSYSSDVNGVKTSGGSSSSMLNDNGKVKEKGVIFRQDPE